MQKRDNSAETLARVKATASPTQSASSRLNRGNSLLVVCYWKLEPFSDTRYSIFPFSLLGLSLPDLRPDVRVALDLRVTLPKEMSGEAGIAAAERRSALLHDDGLASDSEVSSFSFELFSFSCLTDYEDTASKFCVSKTICFDRGHSTSLVCMGRTPMFLTRSLCSLIRTAALTRVQRGPSGGKLLMFRHGVYDIRFAWSLSKKTFPGKGQAAKTWSR